VLNGIEIIILFQFHRPIGVVEELFPASVAGMAEVDVDERIVLRFGGFLDECQAGLLRRSAALFHVTFGAGANYI